MARRHQHVLDLALIAAAALVAFCNVFPNTFHLDDMYRIVENPGIAHVRPLFRHFIDPSTSSSLPGLTQFRPLLPLTLSLNYWWGGESPAGYHAVNLAFHVVSAMLAYIFLLQLEAPRPAALAASLVFAVHPVSGIVVNYVSARDLAMMQTFMLASLVSYARMRRRGRDTPAGWAATMLFAFLAILSKTGALILPVLIAAYELVVLRTPWRARDFWVRIAVFAIVPIDFAFYTRLALRYSDVENAVRDDPGGVMAYALAQTKVHAIYLFNFLWPFNVHQMPLLVPPAHWLNPYALVTALLLIGSLVLAWRLRIRMPAVAFCILAYWILLIPEGSFVPLVHTRVDYRPYPSSAFLFGAIAVSLVTLLPRAAFAAAAGIAIVALTAASLQINRTWRTEQSLWTYSVARGGESAAHLSLAMSIHDRNDPRVRQHLERAIELDPDSVPAQSNYGLWLLAMGNEDGLAHCRRAVALAPNWSRPHFWLAIAYEDLGMFGPAAEEAFVAHELDPKNLQLTYETARLAQKAGRYEESLPLLRSLSTERDFEHAREVQALIETANAHLGR